MKSLLLLIAVFTIGTTSFARDEHFMFTTSDSVQLYVRLAGQGKPCLFVHGGPGSTSYYFEVTDAARLIEQKCK